MVTMQLQRCSLSFESMDIEGRVSRECPANFDEDGIHYEGALEVIYTDGTPSVPHYQVMRLAQAMQNLGDNVLAITDSENPTHRTILMIYIGHSVGS